MVKKTAPPEFSLETVPHVLHPRPIDEAVRQLALESLNILDTAPEERLDLITRLAQRLFGVETCAISLIDSDRQWFKSRIGLAVEETSRSVAFCDHTIRQYDTMVVPDAQLDSRFQTNPLVTGDPHIRFYAGYPIEVGNGQPIGSFCIFDPKPRTLTEKEKDLLRDLALIAQNALMAIVAASNDPISSFTLDGIITSWNPVAESLFGYTADEMIGQSYLVFVPSEKAHESADFREKARKGQSIANYETVRLRKDGSAVPVSMNISPIYDLTGAVNGVSAIYRDITELKNFETQKVLFSAIVAASNDAITSYSLDGILTSWNPAAERIFGYTADEVIGQPFAVLVPSEHTDESADRMERIRKGQPLEHFETVLLRKDGSTVPMSINVSPIYDSTGAIIGGSSISRDLTDRNKAEKKFRDILESSPDAMVIIDKTGTIAIVNSQTEKIFGYRRNELLGQPMRLLLSSQLHADLPSRLDRFFADPQAQSMGEIRDLYGRRKDGYEFPIDTSLSSIETADGILVVSTFRDVTEHKQMIRQLEEMNELRNEFVAVVTHDLRSPMTSISGYAHLLVEVWDTASDEEKIEYLKIIARNTERLAQFVEDALQVARIETGEYTYDIGAFDIRLVVQRALGEADGANVGRRFELIAPQDIPLVLGDQDRQWQVLTNLLSNAVKFSPAEEPITVELSRIGDAVQVAVTDRGIGIVKDDIAKLFQKFGRVSQSGGGNVPGNGLGLYICKTLVEAQGGRIWCESSPGRGSTFYFTIPVAP